MCCYCACYYNCSCYRCCRRCVGTGILGLPVKLVRCGFWPFVVVFSVGCAMQLVGIVLMTDVLQHARLRMRAANVVEGGAGISSTLLLRPGPRLTRLSFDAPTRSRATAPDMRFDVISSCSDRDVDREQLLSTEYARIDDAGVGPATTAKVESPNLHSLGTMLLSNAGCVSFGRRIYGEIMRQYTQCVLYVATLFSRAKLFDVVVLAHFWFILTSYALAGSLSYSSLTTLSFSGCLSGP